jgi:beta-galactosidase
MNADRRTFLKAAAAPALALPAPAAGAAALARPSLEVPLDGEWMLAVDGAGAAVPVVVPHTWNTMPQFADYKGWATYRREFHVPAEFRGRRIHIEFEAVFHTAEVRVNGKPAGEHRGKGYTAFEFDITTLVQFGGANAIEVRVDNSFSDTMLPRNNSYDWTMDGGIYRPVRLLVSPAVYLKNLAVDAVPDLAAKTAAVTIRAEIVGGGSEKNVRYTICEEATGKPVASGSGFGTARIDAPKLWHFDSPHLYRAQVSLGEHMVETTFGIRRIEVRDGGLYLNGERVWLHGVERMAGSHPVYGMAEPARWIDHDHDDMKELNCAITRVHWPQDRRVLDYCDRNGILMQLEVPTWGPATWKGMTGDVMPAIMQNALEQLREMIARDRNHPSVFAWGLCNEVNGQTEVARKFVRRMKEEARKLDPHRLLTYASNSLQKTPEKDVAGELDFISWNEYYESWQKGTVESVRENLRAIEKAFPGKMIVVSEYGYCECTADRLGGDAKRLDILREHNRIFRESPRVGGLIFFCYNDYRTHIGDKGAGVTKQRVHGVVDLYGARKPSFVALRNESSPVESVTVGGGRATVTARNRIPCHTLRGYKLRWVAYGFGNLPLEQGEAELPDMKPGESRSVPVAPKGKEERRVVFDVVRPTGFSAFTAEFTLKG